MKENLEKKINNLDNYFSVLLDNFEGAVLIEDCNRRILFVNEQYIKMFASPVPAQEIIGQNCKVLLEKAKYYFTNPDRFAKIAEERVINKVAVHGERIELVNGLIFERAFIPVIENDKLLGQIWIYRDLSDQLAIEKSLKYRLRFEELLTTLSYSFISTRFDDLDKSIDEALGDIGRFIKTDRSYVFEFASHYDSMSNTYEWCNKGISPEKENLQNLPIESFPWMMKILRKFDSVVIPSVEELPDEAAGERQVLLMQGIKSVIIVPLVYSNQLVGFLGFDAVTDFRNWDSDSVKLLRVFGNVLSGALKRREDEIEVKNALIREKELNELKSRFVTLVSHEFRTPLAAILSSTEILEYYSNNLSDEKKELHYKKIKTSINNLLDILNEISEINLIDSGRQSINSKLFEFSSFLNEILEEIKISYPDKAKINVKEYEDFEMYSDNKLMRQIIINLVSNAIKYTPNEKNIYISVEKRDQSLLFIIRDEGVGIPWRDQPSIFDPFIRSENIKHIKGSGLGLNIAKKATELLSGKINFTSKEGEGTTFTLLLPLKQPI